MHLGAGEVSSSIRIRVSERPMSPRSEGPETKHPIAGCLLQPHCMVSEREVLFKSLDCSLWKARADFIPSSIYSFIQSFVHPSTHSFIEQIIMGYLLCARQCTKNFAGSFSFHIQN